MKKYKVIGLMSGTSLDGLDLAYCHIWKMDDTWEFEIKETKSISYSPEMRAELKGSIFLSADGLLSLNNGYGTWLGEQVKRFIRQRSLAVDCIASHGHTTHHQPESGLTYQIGSGQHLANASGHKVVCDLGPTTSLWAGRALLWCPLATACSLGSTASVSTLGVSAMYPLSQRESVLPTT